VVGTKRNMFRPCCRRRARMPQRGRSALEKCSLLIAKETPPSVVRSAESRLLNRKRLLPESLDHATYNTLNSTTFGNVISGAFA